MAPAAAASSVLPRGRPSRMRSSSEWTARHDGTFVLPIEQGLAIGRLFNAAGFGEVLDSTRR